MWRCQDDILVPDVKQLDKHIEDAVNLANWGKPVVDLTKWKKQEDRYQIVRLLNLEDMQREEKRWGDNLSLGREWLRDKVQEVKSSGVDLVYRNHFERDAEGNLVFPQSSCSRLWSVQLLPNSLPVRALVSFPGSGNTHPSHPLVIIIVISIIISTTIAIIAITAIINNNIKGLATLGSGTSLRLQLDFTQASLPSSSSSSSSSF